MSAALSLDSAFLLALGEGGERALLGPSGVLVAYLFGAISFSYCIVRVLKGIDIRTVGSGNAGATNVLRVAGKGPALAALLLDIGKGAMVIVVLRSLGVAAPWVASAAVAAVLGHIYPIWMGFRGGKGVATAVGTLAVLSLRPTALLLVTFVAVVASTRFVSLGSVLAATLAPVAMLLGGRLGWIGSEALAAYVAAAAVIGGVVVWKHRENLQRLRSGTESRLGQKAKDATVGEGAGE
ncbi:MAG: glycerol-3-phosphate 1-O-acyltransferase PlsY [Acidobacteriota bacterium]